MPSVFSRFKYQLLLLLVLLLTYWQVIFFRHALTCDILDQYLPWRNFISLCIRNGQLPLWNPYLCLGYPIHADPQSGAWYPFVWIYSIFHVYDLKAISIEYFLHAFAGGLGMMCLVKSLGQSRAAGFVAAVAYSLSGIYAGNAQHLTFCISAAWIPFILNHIVLMYRRNSYKHAIYAAFFCFLLLSGGYPAFTIILLYILLIFTLYKVFILIRNKSSASITSKILLPNTLLLIVTLLLSAPYLVSVMGSWSETVRVGSGLSDKQINFGAFTPQCALSFIAPFAVARHTEVWDTDVTMDNAYFGIFVLILFCFSLFRLNKPKILLLILSVTALMATFGDYTFFRSFLAAHVPLMNLFRFPSTFRLFVIIGCILCSALAFDSLFESGKRFMRLLLIALGLFLCIIVTAVFYVDRAHLDSIIQLRYSDIFLKFSIAESLVFQGTIQFILLTAFAGLYQYKIFNSRRLFLCFVVLDMFLAFQLNDPVTITEHQLKFKNVENTFNSFPTQLNKRPDKSLKDEKEGQVSPFWRNMPLLHKTLGYNGYNSFQLTKWDFMLEKHKDQIHFNSEIITDSAVTFSVLKFEPGLIQIHAQAPKNTVLVVQQINYKGWEAKVNGKKIQINSDSTLLTLALSAGKSEVVFQYNPFPVKIMFFISCIALLLLGIYTIRTEFF